MANYELTKAADRRLVDIYRYSVATFGLDVARRYLKAMHSAFELISENPQIGTDQSWVASGCRRMVCESHVIYYVPHTEGVLILEVLVVSSILCKRLLEDLIVCFLPEPPVAIALPAGRSGQRTGRAVLARRSVPLRRSTGLLLKTHDGRLSVRGQSSFLLVSPELVFGFLFPFAL